MLREGSRGPQVREWQEFLIELGHLAEGEADGVFGPLTAEASKSWQAMERIAVDALIGPMSLAAARAKGFLGGRQFDPMVATCAKNLGIKVELLEAFRRVESGTGPDADSAIRFEPHVAIRKLGGRASERIPYTPQSAPRARSRTRAETSRAAFEAALAMQDDEVWKRGIVESTSFGLFQVLGGVLLDLFPGEAAEECVRFFFDDSRLLSFALLGGWFHANPRALACAKEDPPNLRRLVRYYNGGGQVDAYTSRLKQELARITGSA